MSGTDAKAVSGTRPEHRWPASVAILIALVIYALLPSSFTPG